MKGLEAVLERRGVPRPSGRGRSRPSSGSATSTTTASPPRARRALADRGYGDEAIRFELAREGLDAERVEAAVEGLAPELDRARRL